MCDDGQLSADEPKRKQLAVEEAMTMSAAMLLDQLTTAVGPDTTSKLLLDRKNDPSTANRAAVVFWH